MAAFRRVISDRFRSMTNNFHIELITKETFAKTSIDVLQVNSWHWQEKDILPWAKQRLQELLGIPSMPRTPGREAITVAISM